MWQAISDFVMTWLDPVSVVLGLIVTLPVFWTWHAVVFGERRRRQRWFRQIQKQPGQRPALLIVDLLPGREVRAAVEVFRQTDKHLRQIPDDRIFTLTRSQILRPEDMPDLHEDIRRLAGKMLASGADRVHYYHAGPSVAAALVGAELANTFRVILYQHQPGEGYRNFGPLKAQP